MGRIKQEINETFIYKYYLLKTISIGDDKKMNKEPITKKFIDMIVNKINKKEIKLYDQSCFAESFGASFDFEGISYDLSEDNEEGTKIRYKK